MIIKTGKAQSEVDVEYKFGFGKPYRTSSLGSFYGRFSNNGKRSFQIGAHYTFASGTGTGRFGISAAYRYGFAYGESGNLVIAHGISFSFFDEAKGSDKNQIRPSTEPGYHDTFSNFGKCGFTTLPLARDIIFDRVARVKARLSQRVLH